LRLNLDLIDWHNKLNIEKPLSYCQKIRNRMIGVLNCYGLPEEDNEDNYIINEEDEFEGKVGE
jgi:hypothetical protein